MSPRDASAASVREKVWAAADSGDLVTVCAWCSLARIDTEWVELPAGLLETIDQPMTLSHSVCPACLEGRLG